METQERFPSFNLQDFLNVVENLNKFTYTVNPDIRTPCQYGHYYGQNFSAKTNQSFSYV